MSAHNNRREVDNSTTSTLSTLESTATLTTLTDTPSRTAISQSREEAFPCNVSGISEKGEGHEVSFDVGNPFTQSTADRPAAEFFTGAESEQNTSEPKAAVLPLPIQPRPKPNALERPKDLIEELAKTQARKGLRPNGDHNLTPPKAAVVPTLVPAPKTSTPPSKLSTFLAWLKRNKKKTVASSAAVATSAVSVPVATEVVTIAGVSDFVANFAIPTIGEIPTILIAAGPAAIVLVAAIVGLGLSFCRKRTPDLATALANPPLDKQLLQGGKHRRPTCNGSMARPAPHTPPKAANSEEARRFASITKLLGSGAAAHSALPRGESRSPSQVASR